MTTPALNIPIKVVGLDTFKQNMNEMNVTAANAARAVTATTIKMSASFLASQGAAGAATLAFGRMLTVLRPIALGVTAVVDTFEFLKKSVELAGQQIEAFNAIADKAKGAGLSTDFWQRFTKSAPNAVLSIDQITEALQRFNQASTDRLGGSDLQQRIDELVKAGNFTGNAGLGAFAGSTTTEQKLRAIVSLIDQAMTKGQRLAALDIASKAFGEPVAAALRADNGYLDQMLRKADTMSKAEIVTQEDIGRAIQLRDRMDEAQKILAEKWVPIQRDMAQLGINFKDNWVSVVETFAQLVGLADKLYATLKQIPDVFAAMGNASIWTRFTEMTGALGLNSDPASLGIETGLDARRLDGTNRLRAALMNPANVQRAMQETTGVQSAVRGDTSIAPKDKTATDQNDKVDTAINALRRHTQQVEADTKAVGLGEAALARFRAQAAETAAVQANNGKETADQAAQFKKLQEQAGAAADALAKAKVNSDISYGRQTAFLSPEDVQIASQLKGIYGDDVPRALQSTEAAAIRLNNAMKGLGDSFSNSLNGPLTDFEMGTKTATQSLQSFASSFARSLLQMANQGLIIKPLLSGIGGLFGLGGSAPIMSSGLGAGTGGLSFPMFADGGEVSGPGGPRDDRVVARVSPGEFIVNAASTAKHRALLEQINRAPRFADGGLVGSGGAAPMIGGQHVIAPQVNVTVQGNPGMSQADHREMGAAVAKAAQAHIQKTIEDTLRQQMRPGGVLKR